MITALLMLFLAAPSPGAHTVRKIEATVRVFPALSAAAVSCPLSPAPTLRPALPAPGFAGAGVPPPLKTVSGLSPASELAVGLPAGGQPLIQQIAAEAAGFGEALRADPSGLNADHQLERLFGGRGRREKPARSRGGQNSGSEAVFTVNDDGVKITGRAAKYYKVVNEFVERYKDKIDLTESLGVMGDSYGDVWSKLSTMEAVARDLGVRDHSTRIKETLDYVDGVFEDGGRRVAVLTHRVYFHRAKDPSSEINEGIRRVGHHVDDMLRLFGRYGRAERQLGRLDEIVLGFDTRGYPEIKEFLRQREREIAKGHGRRFRFVFTDEAAPMPASEAEMLADLNRLIVKYKDDGLQKIIEGVIYSRYTGLLLELKTLEFYYKKGYEVVQSGREIFDENGQYVTELDTVVKSPDGTTYLVEAKRASVPIPKEDVLRKKILYKLEVYKKQRERLEKLLGAPLNVVFSLDVGGLDYDLAELGILSWKQPRQKALMEYLRRMAPELSRRYGFPVSFIFLNSGPEFEAVGHHSK